MDDQADRTSAFVSLTVHIVEAYVANNNIGAASLPELISTVHSAMTNLGKPQLVAEPTPTPAVPIKKSVTPDYIVSLEDGRHYKSLKRHLSGRGMTPDQYRAKWGLAGDYPMVAPNYAKQRSELARTMGLGRKRTEPEPVATRQSHRKAA